MNHLAYEDTICSSGGMGEIGGQIEEKGAKLESHEPKKT
jgi:hypothetical protein